MECPCILHIFIFPSKIWAKRCTLHTAKYGNRLALIKTMKGKQDVAINKPLGKI